MTRKNLMNILVTAAGVGLVLVGYNAFLNSNNDTTENNASTKLGSYLRLDSTKQEAGDEDAKVATDAAPDAAASTPAPADSTASTPAAATQTSESAPVVELKATPGDAAAATYTVKAGDTYGCIAEKYYGSFEHYTDIMAANPVYDYGFTEYGLFEGAVLQLPAIKAENKKPASSICG